MNVTSKPFVEARDTKPRLLAIIVGVGGVETVHHQGSSDDYLLAHFMVKMRSEARR